MSPTHRPDSDELVLDQGLPTGPLVIEASAGTGKTYSVTALVVRHIAEVGLSTSGLLIVTYTRAAAAELRDRTRRALVLARDACDSGAVPPGQEWMSVLVADDGHRDERRERLALAVSSFDDATISTIHGFCQQALAQIGLRSGRQPASEISNGSLKDIIDQVCLDLVLARLAATPTALSWMGRKDLVGPSSVLECLRATVEEVLSSPSAVKVPSREQLASLAVPLPEWCGLVDRAVELVHERRMERMEFGFDDLITGLHHALCRSDDRVHNCRSLQQRFQLVLVDESQDNDPLQWEIFDAAFSERMITVGDPKQAIYRFRGADVYSYLRHADGLPLKRLATNHRSDPDLVAATDLLIGGMQLGHDRIEVHPVHAVEGKALSALSSGAPLQVRRVPLHPHILGQQGRPANDEATAVVLADLTRVVDELLSGDPTIDDAGVERPLHAGDIAVLVANKNHAELVVRALAGSGIPAVRTRTGSVYQTTAVREWRTLLHALARPTDVGRVSAAALGVFLERPVADLDPMSEHAAITDLQRLCVEWSTQLARSSWLGWYDRVRHESGLVARLLERPNGERTLTDLDHIAELLAADLGTAHPSSALALSRLEHLSSRPSDESSDSSPEMRRVDSDAHAVKISTIHTSKGLEYPIVLLPFLWRGIDDSAVTVFNDDDGQRVIDTATPYKWASDEGDLGLPDERERRGRHATWGDRLRVLYVALTRARHRTVVWWAPTASGKQCPLGSALFDRDEALMPLNSLVDVSATFSMPPIFSIDDDDATVDGLVAERLDALAAVSGGRLVAATIDPELDAALHEPTTAQGGDDVRLEVAEGRPVKEPSWKRWSFTGITRRVEEPTFESPVTGGVDEPSPDIDNDDDAVLLRATSEGTVSTAMPWASVAGGKEFGVVVHDVLERIDPRSSSLREDLQRITEHRLSGSGLHVDPTVVVDGVERAMQTPLGPLFDECRLVDISRTDRLAELRFDMPLVSSIDDAVAASLIGEVLLRHLAPNDPLRPYAEEIAAGRFNQRLAGYLQGSIDAVLRIGTTSSPRFVVVDYKTNQLHDRDAADPLSAYQPSELPRAMAHSDYPLQAILYSVALHRYLRWRLPDYDPDSHLGGIGYLFLRGMVGDDTPRREGLPFGVFSWRPPAATIVELDRLLATGAMP